MITTRKEFILKSLLAGAGLSGLSGLLGERESLSPLKKSTSPNQSASAGFKISIFSKHLQWLDYPEMAEVAAEIGFEGVDLTVRPGGHVLPERVREDLPKAVEAVRRAGLDVYMITTAITDPQDQQSEIILKTAGNLGIKNYRTGWFSYNHDISIPENLESFRSKFLQLAALNDKYGIRGDYQNHSGTSLGASIWDLWMMLNDTNSQWIGSQYDIRHATVEGAQSWPLGLRLIGPFIGSIDIKDFQWTKRKQQWQVENVPLGEGMVNFNRYFELLGQLGITAPISLHYEYPLGGAEHGASTLSVERAQVLGAIQRDLEILKSWLKDAGLKK